MTKTIEEVVNIIKKYEIRKDGCGQEYELISEIEMFFKDYYLVEKEGAKERIMDTLEKDAKVKVLKCSKLSGYCSEVERCSKCEHLTPIAQAIIKLIGG